MTVRLSAVGDIALSGKIADAIRAHGPAWVLQDVGRVLDPAGLVVANFEFPATRERRAHILSARPHMFTEPEHVEARAACRWSVFTIATNHVLDWGPEGISTTRELLQRGGAQVIGAGLSIREAGAPACVDCQGIRFAFLAYCKRGEYDAGPESPGANPLVPAIAVQDVVRLKQGGADHVIVSLHWGVEFSSYPAMSDVHLARSLVDAGASLIIGHHPHTLQGIERYGTGVIAYSLGNFVADMTLDRPPREEAWQLGHRGGILRVEFDEKSVVGMDFVPTLIDGSMQTVVPGELETGRIRAFLREISRDIGTDKFYETALPNLAAREARAWLAKIREHGPAGLLLLLRTLKWKHLRMAIGYAGVQIKRVLHLR